MSKRAKIIIGIVVALFVVVLLWLGKKNTKTAIQYDTTKAFKTDIVKKTVATGKVVPLEEVEIKPQISGIVEKVLVEEGAIVKAGDLLATVRVVPSVQSLNSANNEIKNARVSYENAKRQFNRNKTLFEKGVIARQAFESSELTYNTSLLRLNNAKSNRDIVKRGTTAGLGSLANTNIRATANGMVVEVPIKKGYQVVQTNNFNPGTTIARIADMNKMIFEGKVDESEVGKLVKGTALDISIGAIEGKKYPAILNFIAPKGTEEGGAVQFKIKADVTLDDENFIRAGYSANADIVLEKKENVLAIKESLLRFDKKTEKPYVEVKISDDKFEKKTIKLGTSDGVNVQILEGITLDDELKIWNKASKEGEKEDKNKKG